MRTICSGLALLSVSSIAEANGDIRAKDRYKTTHNTGKDIWKKLLSQCPNIKFAICGHTATRKIMASFRIEKRADGYDFPMMMFNPQAISGWQGNGGDGWVRILEFKPDGKTVSVLTYSPFLRCRQALST